MINTASNLNASSILNTLAQAYWHDYQNNQPIAKTDGGVAYEPQLRQCKLDGSIESLKELDVLLTSVRQNLTNQLAKNSAQPIHKHQQQILTATTFRNFVKFIGFYTGTVLANQWQAQPMWHDVSSLKATTANTGFSINDNDFFHSAAVEFVPTHNKGAILQTQVANLQMPWLFFVYEPIGMRLFGSFAYQVASVQGQKRVADSLYQAVLQRLPSQDNNLAATAGLQTTHASSQPQTFQQPQAQQPANHVSSPVLAHANNHNQSQSQNRSTISGTHQHVDTNALHVAKTTATHTSNASNASMVTEVDALNNSADAVMATNNDATASNIHSQNPTHATPVVKVGKQANKTNIAKVNNAQTKTATHVDLLRGLKQDMEEIEVAQTTGITDYAKASKIMQQFDDYASKQNKPTDQLVFSDAHTKARQQALALLKQAANAGNSNAMLHLSMYLLKGDWLTANEEQAIQYIQTAANAGDCRAMRLLSKLYYQGTGVARNMEMGKHWLDLAADNGHSEAKQVVQQMELSQMLVTERHEDLQADKRLYWVLGMVAVVSILIFILI